MIELLQTLSSLGTRQVRQELVSPSVYLDNWAIREFAENPELGERFRSALLRAKGTLALSDINLLEFTGVSDPSHTQAAGRFADSLLPHLFLMRCDPIVVIQREIELLLRKREQSPAGDEKALAQFAEAAARRNDRFSASAWFSIVHSERAKLQFQIPGIAQVLYAQIGKLRERIVNEPDILKLEPAKTEAARNRPTTLALLRAIMKDVQADHQLPEDQNSAIDLLHTVVPGAYCDFVLLDRQWCARLRRAAKELAASGVGSPVGASYSKPKGGVEKFLTTLEVWPETVRGTRV